MNTADSFKGKQPKEEEHHVADPIGLQRQKPEFVDDLNSYSRSSRIVPKPLVSSKVLQRQLKYKERRMVAMGMPKLIQSVSYSSMNRMVAKDLLVTSKSLPIFTMDMVTVSRTVPIFTRFGVSVGLLRYCFVFFFLLIIFDYDYDMCLLYM